MKKYSFIRAKKQNAFLPTKWIKMLFIVMAFLSFNANAQMRPNINTLDVDAILTTVQEQEELACLIKNYLDADPNFIMMHMMRTDIHTTPNILTWHNFYINMIEEYLTSIGMSKYVPLPKWDPNTTIPNAFYNGSCAAATGYTGPSTQNISNSFFANILSTLCTYTTRADLSSGINGPHGTVHGQVGGSMCCLSTAPGASIFYLWHGYLDDLWKQWECSCTGSPSQQISGVDLFMKDLNQDLKTTLNDGLDIGYEPFPVTESLSTLPIYNSTDIWVRDGVDASGTPVNDGIANQIHENPDYSVSGIPNYVYIRVRNRGCQASSGNEQLKVYWARASSGLIWPADFNNHLHSGVLHGDIIGTQTIAPLQPGAIAIYAFPWNPPNPVDFGDDPVNVGTHTCLLARIVNTSLSCDGMTFCETNDIAYNTVQNNNVIWKNMYVFDNPTISNKTRFVVANPCDKDMAINLKFAVPQEDLQNKQMVEGNFTDGVTNVIDLGKEEVFTDYGMVTIDLGKEIYDKWVQGGKKGSNIQEGKFSHMSPTGILHHHSPHHYPNAPSPYSVLITGPNATLENLNFKANEELPIQIQLNYRAQPEGENKMQFNYLIAQEAASPTADCSGIGGIAFDITRPECSIPDAGPNVTIGRNCKITLTALPIIAGAIYNWYDNNTGTFIGTGQTIEVSPNKTTSYELQMSSPNGCVDFDVVTVNVSNTLTACIDPNGCFESITVFPNPVSDNRLSMEMVSRERANVNITLTDMTGKVRLQENRMIDQGTTTEILDITKIPQGVYNLIIRCKEKEHTEVISRF